MSTYEMLEMTPEMERELIALAKNHQKRFHNSNPAIKGHAQRRANRLICEALNLLH